MQDDGNLVLYDKDNKPVWASNTDNKGFGPYYLEMHPNSKLIIYGNKTIIW